MGIHTHRNQKMRKREKALKRLHLFLEMQDGKCFWCHREIVFARLLNCPHTETHKTVTWKENGQIRTALKATADHLGSLDDYLNIVASCLACNELRNQGKLKDNRTCILCSGSNCEQCLWWNACEICRNALEAEWLISLGWEYWHDSPYYWGWWQHPTNKKLFTFWQAKRLQSKEIESPIIKFMTPLARTQRGRSIKRSIMTGKGDEDVA